VRTDADLVLAVRAGDDGALAEIYDRYASPIHDFCASVLRESHEAADAMQDTFVAAVTRIDQLREPAKLRSWLFAIARHEALRRAKRRGRARPTEGVGAELAAAGDTPEDEVTARSDAAAASAIVWEAAAGLADRDRVLLDLHLRQGLDGADLADAIGSTPDQAYVMMSRLRVQVERSIGALLVARQGREDCDDLQVLLDPWDGTFSPLWRKRVARHVEDCETCERTKRRVLPLYGAAPALAAPAALRAPVVDAMRRARGAAAPTGRGWRDDGFPPPLDGGRGRGRSILAGSGVAVLLAGGAAVLLTGGTDDGRAARVGSTERPAVTTPTSAPTATTSTEPAATAEPTVPVTTGSAVPGPVAPTAPTAPTAPPAPAPDSTGPTISGPVAQPGLITWPRQCPPPYTSTVTATIDDPSGVASVTARVSSTFGVSTTTLTGGPIYSLTVGPFADLVEPRVVITVTFVATDTAGNSTSATTTLVWSSGC